MLIFHRFPSRALAEDFANTAKRFGLVATIYRTQAESGKVDPYPFKLRPPIVLVERSACDSLMDSFANFYGGYFAGE